MKILIIHNKYGKHSGEESVVYAQEELLRSKGHEVDTYYRSSEEIRGVGGQVNAFFSGFYNSRSVREIRQRTEDGRRQTADSERVDIVHIHNLYPLISPAILPVIKSQNQHHPSSLLTAHRSLLTTSPPHHLSTSPPEIVMTVHNYRLICPNGLFFTHGEICERCAHGREWNCILYNCEGTGVKSTGYALRNFAARVRRSYLDNVSQFLCLTEFQKGKLLENGFPPEKVSVLPNFIRIEEGPEEKKSAGGYAIFAGRLNRQKGIDVVLEAFSILDRDPENAHPYSLIAAGSPDTDFMSKLTIPANVRLTGNVSSGELSDLYRNARFLLFTSRSYEGFPMVFLEAMKHQLPVIAPALAGFPEIIADGINGLLFTPGDAEDLAAKIRVLWSDPDLCERMGLAGFNKAREMYSENRFYEGLMEQYERAVQKTL